VHERLPRDPGALLDLLDAMLEKIVLGGVRKDLDELTGGVPPDRHDGVDDEVQPAPVPGELHRDAVDEKGHVVDDELDDRVQ
jgi:hypothetical protein